MANADFLAICHNLAKNVLETNKTAYINIKIGREFSFTFNNQDRSPFSWKKKSPSQTQRDQRRMNQFQTRKAEAEAAQAKPIEEVKLDDRTADKKEENNDFQSYEMQFDAQKCSDKDIEECFEFNFKDELKKMNVKEDDTIYEFIKKDAKIVLKKDGKNYKSLKAFEVKVKNIEQIKEAIEVFNVTWNFDPACFKGAIRNENQANLMEFKKL
jgi:hypothetical protein